MPKNISSFELFEEQVEDTYTMRFQTANTKSSGKIRASDIFNTAIVLLDLNAVEADEDGDYGIKFKSKADYDKASKMFRTIKLPFIGDISHK